MRLCPVKIGHRHFFLFFAQVCSSLHDHIHKARVDLEWLQSSLVIFLSLRISHKCADGGTSDCTNLTSRIRSFLIYSHPITLIFVFRLGWYVNADLTRQLGS